MKKRRLEAIKKKKEAELKHLRKELIKIKKIERLKREIEQKKKDISSIKSKKTTKPEENDFADKSSSEIQKKLNLNERPFLKEQ